MYVLSGKRIHFMFGSGACTRAPANYRTQPLGSTKTNTTYSQSNAKISDSSQLWTSRIRHYLRWAYIKQQIIFITITGMERIILIWESKFILAVCCRGSFITMSRSKTCYMWLRNFSPPRTFTRMFFGSFSRFSDVCGVINFRIRIHLFFI